MTITILTKATQSRRSRKLDSSAPRRPRSHLQFAREELYLATGPLAGRLYDPKYMPFHALIFSYIFDDPWWRECWGFGGVQAGKTLAFLVEPAQYHLFERMEDVILFGPTDKIAHAVWVDKILPSVEANSKFKELLPTTGKGSRGGMVDQIRFKHGPTIRFEGMGGGDKSGISHTAPCVLITEADRFDRAGESDRDTDPVRKARARTQAFPIWRRRLYADCTVTTEDGAVWVNGYINGSGHEPTARCPGCGEHIRPNRESLEWDEDAKDAVTLAESAGYRCPCGALWGEKEREIAINQALLVAKWEHVEDGKIIGGSPKTRVAGVRWSYLHAPAREMGEIANDEQKNRDNPSVEGEKELCQHAHGIPYREPDEIQLIEDDLLARANPEIPFGPPGDDAAAVTVGVDVHLRHLDVVCLAFDLNVAAVAVYWNVIRFQHEGVPSTEDIVAALNGLADEFLGWERPPDKIVADTKWENKAVMDFCRSRKKHGWQAGSGFSSRTEPWSPKKRSKKMGDGWRMARVKGKQVLEIDVDRHKTLVHRGLLMPSAKAWSLTFAAAPKRALKLYVRHLMAERRMREWDKRRGLVYKWVPVTSSPENHLLDATVYAWAAGHLLGLGDVAKKDDEGLTMGRA